MRVTHEVSVRQIVLVPRNGLANRLQAWASSLILADTWNVPLHVVWETEKVMPATATDIFSNDVNERWIRPTSILEDYVGARHAELPRYLNRIGDTLVLAGHDRGEQSFMERVRCQVEASDGPSNLVIIAGGKFSLHNTPDFDAARSRFYKALMWSDAVEARFSKVHQDLSFSALHIRGTDRALEAPTSRAFQRALHELRRTTAQDRLFICADSLQSLNKWVFRTKSMGFAPFTAHKPELDRALAQSTVDAAVDWRMLARASAIVFPAASTFSGEASIAAGEYCSTQPLHASRLLRNTRRAARASVSAITYPARRWIRF